MKKIKRICCIIVCCIMVLNLLTPIQAAGRSVSQRTVRVGFFSSDGYHMMDEEGTMSGYGYDFLQMMLRYNNWEYEYVGYDLNWGDMISMLENGEIDMVTLANKTPEREAKFDYSEKPIGTSSTIMTISSYNKDIIPGDYSTYDGKVVGLVEGSSHNEKYEEYAMEHGFSCEIAYYEDISDLITDLRVGKNIDMAVTSNMRQVKDEIILDEFNSTEYYAIVKKGNEELLDEIDTGIAQLNVYTPEWKSTLFQKYYAEINSEVLSFSVEEREYLAELKENKTVIKVAMNPELKPYAYFKDGEARGIAPVIMAEVARRLDIKYEILESKNRWEYKEQLNSGQAVLDLTAYLDYSLAQKNNLKETNAYMNSALAMLLRKDSNTEKDRMVVAVLRDPTEYVGYNSELIDQYHHKEYESIQDCVNAVKNGEADATFLYVYIAEQAVLEDYKGDLQYNIMQDYIFSLAIGVDKNADHRLLSVLDKGINSLSSAFTQGVTLEESTKVEQKKPAIAIVYEYPWMVVCLVVFVLLILFVLISFLLYSRTQRNKLLASAEIERFIGYVCESYYTVAEINLCTKKRTIYYMVDGVLKEEQKEHTPFDRAYFEPIVHEEDLEMMVDAFSEENIDKTIEVGGGEKYIECQVKKPQGNYNWYSYIIKAVPKDERHPRNFVVFKKDIQETKMDEEEQKQVLRDALENAKSSSAAKGQFLSRMSHEIRTPLNAVIGYMEIAKDAADNPAKMMHCVVNSNIAAKHLLSIINDVLDISSIESGKTKIAHEEFDLKNQITAITTIFFNQTKAKGVKFDVTLDNVMEEWVVGDSLRLNQILMNLLSNAVKFTPENGSIKLAISQVNIDEKKVFMRFIIKDSGIGMSEEYRERLFKPFEQESAATAQKYGGTGLGLSITYNLIQMMGGSIEVESKQKVGTTFNVSLHFDRCFTKHEDAQVQHDYSHVRALIVDDDEAACEYMKSLLKRCKVKSTVVSDGEAAIKQIKRRMGTEYSYDICIMDWNMPNMNGMETAKRIKEECDPNMPIIIATAYDVTEIEDQANEMGIDKVIAKPLFQSTMFDLLVTTYGKYEPVAEKEKSLESIKGLRVLLAEDNPMNLEIAMEILNKAGLVVDAVTDGKQAVDRFLERPQGSYDVILMDVQMPVMDGYQATGAIRKSEHPEARSIPIVAMTANAFAEDVNEALASGMDGHIAKPVDYDKLYAVLNKFCVDKEG